MATVRRAALAAPLLLLGFLLLPPFGRPYSPGLDPGYAWGVAEAFRQGAVAGRDVVFPYGPLGFLLLGPPDRALAPWSLLYSLGLHAATLAGFWILLARRRSVALAWAFAAAVLLVHALFYSSSEHEPVVAVAALLMPALAGAPLAPAVAGLVGAIAALALLVKLSAGAVAGALVAATACALALRGRAGRGALAALLGAVAAVLALALAMHFGSIATFLAWLRQEAALARGYASAMSVAGPRGVEATGALVLAALAVAAAAARRLRLAGAGLWLGLLPAAWLVYRHGFVRADGHLYAFAYVTLLWILCAGLVLPAGGARRIGAAVLGVALVCALATTARVERPGSVVPFDLVTGRNGLGNLWSYLHAPAHVDALAAWSWESLLPLQVDSDPLARWREEGSTFDVLPWDLLTLPANGLTWRPNPVLQLYQASTTELDERVARHFASPRAPDRIVVHFDPIDGRQLLWEAPSSWRTILARYAPAREQPFPGRLVLERRNRPARWIERPLGAVDLEPGAWVALPEAQPGERILLALDLEPTLAGRARAALFRTERLELSLRGEGVRPHRRRLVPGVAGSGLIVDLPIHGPDDLAAVAASGSGFVRELRLGGPGAASLVRPVRGRWSAARLELLGAERLEGAAGEGGGAGGEAGGDG